MDATAGLVELKTAARVCRRLLVTNVAFCPTDRVSVLLAVVPAAVPEPRDGASGELGLGGLPLSHAESAIVRAAIESSIVLLYMMAR